MTTRTIRTNRVRFFSNAIFALTIAVLLIQLESPRAWTGESLIPWWPTALSYAISYLFIAIVWVNHRYSLNYASIASSRLIWVNFSHMFAISLIPFATTWISQTHLAAIPVSFYACVLAFVNATYLLLCMAIDDLQSDDIPERRIMRLRSLATLMSFAFAANFAVEYPTGGMVLICLCLIIYLRPEALGSSTSIKQSL